MGNGCKGICNLRYSTKKICARFRKDVEEGYRACRKCEVMILTEQKYCPCCGCQLSLLPTKNKYYKDHLNVEGNSGSNMMGYRVLGYAEDGIPKIEWGV